MSYRRPRWASILVVVVTLAAAAIVAVPSIRDSVLRAAGWALVVHEPLAPADVIVVSLASGGAGALEAADLVEGGIATRVAVFTDPPSGEDHEFIRLTRIRPQGRFANSGRSVLLMSFKFPEPTLGLRVKARCFRHGATSISSDLLCSWPKETTRDDCGECSIEP